MITNQDNKTLLHINSSGRRAGSITRQVSQQLVEKIMSAQPQLQLNSRDLASGLPFVNEQWINANFTGADERSDRDNQALSFSDGLVEELKQADILVIGSPIYNFNIPAVLKAWIDLIARAQLTFRYTDKGPVGLLEGKKAYVVIASGGVPIGSEMDFVSPYLKQVLGFVGISDVTIVDASQFDLAQFKLSNDTNAASAEAELSHA
jgi:FMN-dependent NADH-azoreductase